MKFLLLLLLHWLTGTFTDGQGVTKREKYKFTQAWVWQYENDWIQPGETGHKGEIIIYHDSLTKTWLFDVEAYGNSGQGFDFILGNYEGQYTFCFRNDKGKKRKAVRSVSEIPLSRSENLVVLEEFERQNKPTGETRIFGRNVYGWQQFEGQEYVFEHLTNEKTIRYLADTDVDFQSVVYFNFLDGEVKLPFHFPTDVPVGKVLLEDNTTYEDGKRIILRLKEITDTEYHIDLSKYR